MRTRSMARTRKKAREEPQLKIEETHTEEGLKAENKSAFNNFPAYNVPLIWLKNFEKLEPKNKIAFSKTIPEWHDLVGKKRSTFLFPEMAPILIENLPQNALLQSRLLSLSWNQGLDRQYQDHPVRFILPFEITSGGKRNTKLINSFHSSEAIEKFLEDMRDHPGNPFPGGNVEFECKRSQGTILQFDNMMDFWANAFQLCQRFGEHIYSVRFTYDHAISIIRRIARLFRDCLVHLPNLKRLSIRGGWASDLFSEQIRHYFRQFPLPQLQNLEMIDTLQVNGALINVVLDSCPIPGNIKRLSLETTVAGDFELPEMAFSFVNLEVLRAPLLIHDLQRLGNLERVPALREIHFSWQHVSIQPQELFRALEPFSNSLIHLVAPVIVCNTAEWSRTRINLPNLRKFSLKDFYGSMDLFVQLTSLTHLSISFSKPTNYWVDANGLYFLGFEHGMQDSNIWRLIPSLQILSIGTRKFERPSSRVIRQSIQNEG